MQNGNSNNSDTYECVEPPEEPYQSKKIDAPPLPPPLPSWNHAAGTNHRLQRNNYRNSDDSLDDVANLDQINGKIFSAFHFDGKIENFKKFKISHVFRSRIGLGSRGG